MISKNKTILDYFFKSKDQSTNNNTIKCKPQNKILESFVIQDQDQDQNKEKFKSNHQEYEKSVQKREIEKDSDHFKLFVFTDGSQIREKGTHKSLAVAFAYVIKKRSGETLRSKTRSMLPTDTNQRAELNAIYESLLCIMDEYINNQKNINEINIYTDSEYSMKSLTVWCLSWIRNGWKNSKNQAVKNKDIIEPTLNILREFKEKNNVKINIRHIRSHTDRTDFFSIGNQEADQLANSTAKYSIHKKNNK